MNVEGELLLRVGHSVALVGEAEHAGVVVVQDEHRGRARVRERGQALLVRVIGLQAVVVDLERYHRRHRVIITIMEKTRTADYCTRRLMAKSLRSSSINEMQVCVTYTIQINQDYTIYLYEKDLKVCS